MRPASRNAMHVFILVPVFLFALMVLLPGLSAGLNDSFSRCSEGDRRTCGTDVGVCMNGRSVCRDGNWTTCDGEIRPQDKEICGNGLDDDCDGQEDEDCFPWMSLTLVGMGILFIGIGAYYMEREKGERLTTESVSKD